MESDFYRAQALYALLPYLKTSILNYDKWCNILSTLSHLERSKLLERLPMLTKTIINLGSKEALVETAYTIRDISRQW
ncbi:hypothetical protein Lepto7375DRAFT_0696 [Leptolyngbya sp. PCC 7375]|nr:hypothetical protein Lepto7375DRAFT_0696 [Leptolyngbya sp. PCC 7375]